MDIEGVMFGFEIGDFPLYLIPVRFNEISHAHWRMARLEIVEVDSVIA
jgi:hypothetical protein